MKNIIIIIVKEKQGFVTDGCVEYHKGAEHYRISPSARNSAGRLGVLISALRISAPFFDFCHDVAIYGGKENGKKSWNRHGK